MVIGFMGADATTATARFSTLEAKTKKKS